MLLHVSVDLVDTRWCEFQNAGSSRCAEYASRVASPSGKLVCSASLALAGLAGPGATLPVVDVEADQIIAQDQNPLRLLRPASHNVKRLWAVLLTRSPLFSIHAVISAFGHL